MAKPVTINRSAHLDVADGAGTVATVLEINLSGIGITSSGAYFHLEALVVMVKSTVDSGSYLRYRIQGRLISGVIANFEANLEYAYADAPNTPSFLDIVSSGDDRIWFRYTRVTGSNKINISVRGVVGE